MSIIVNDSFQRANANPIGSPYVTGYGDNAVQIVSDQASASTGTSTNSAFDTTNSYQNDQWAQLTIASPIGGNSGEWQLNLRGTNVTISSRGNNAYWHIDYGSTTANMGFYGVGNVHAVTLNTAPAAGDTYYFSVQGQVYSFYQNGSLVGTYTDGNSYATTGVPGFGFFPTGDVTQTIVSNFQTGNFLNSATIAWIV